MANESGSQKAPQRSRLDLATERLEHVVERLEQAADSARLTNTLAAVMMRDADEETANLSSQLATAHDHYRALEKITQSSTSRLDIAIERLKTILEA